MPQFPRLLLAISPGNIPPRLPLPTELAHMTYRIGPRCRLLRAYPEQALTGGFLMISGTASSCIGNLDRFCRQVVSECQLRHAAGVIANWELASQCAPLATQLDRALTQAQLEFWVPEYYAGATINAQIFISSQLSGGSLAARLQEAFDRWGHRIALAIECTPWVFQLPCPSGQGTPLERGPLQQLITDYNPRLWFSEALCTQYFTYLRKEQLHLALFDNGASIRKKLELAARRGLSGVILSWDELAPFVQEVFAPTQRRPGGNRF